MSLNLSKTVVNGYSSISSEYYQQVTRSCQTVASQHPNRRRKFRRLL